MRFTPLLALIMSGLVLLPAAASAQLYGEASESPKSHSFELKFGIYTPQIDEGESTTAYGRAFGGDAMFMTRIEYDYQFWKGFGSLAIGGEFGYAQVSGFGVAHDSDLDTQDETALHMFPFSISLVYHFDVLATRYQVPLVPYVKVGFDYYVWWVTNGLGDTAEYQAEDSTTLFEGAGGTFGWHVQAGIKLLLDFLAPQMAQTFDNEVGVNNTYLFAEMLYADVSDFGSDSSWQLGDLTALFGVAFEF